MAITLNDLIQDITQLEGLSLAEFNRLYQELSEKPFAERTIDDQSLSSFFEEHKKEAIIKNASRLTEMSKDDLEALKSLIGDTMQMSGVSGIDFDNLRSNIDEAIKNIADTSVHADVEAEPMPYDFDFDFSVPGFDDDTPVEEVADEQLEEEPIEEVSDEPMEDVVDETETGGDSEPVEEIANEQQDIFDKKGFIKANLEGKSLDEIATFIDLVNKADDSNKEQALQAIEEFVVSFAKDVNNNKILVLDPKEYYPFKQILESVNREGVDSSVTTALNNINSEIEAFEEEFGLDSLQPDEVINNNYQTLDEIANTDFFARIDAPVTKPWTAKDLEDYKTGALTPTLQGLSGALRSPNLSSDDKEKILEDAKNKLVQLEGVHQDPKAYGDIKLVIDELKNKYPEDESVKEAGKYLARFIEERDGQMLLYPEMADAIAALDKIKVKGDLTLLGRKNVEQNGPDSEIAKLKELARIETETYLANTTPAGQTITPEMFAKEYSDRLNKAILGVAVADQIAKGADPKETHNLMDLLGDNKTIDINQDSFSGYFTARSLRQTSAAQVTKQRRPNITKDLTAKIRAFDKKCSERYGEKYSIAKNMLSSFGWGAAFGVAAKVAVAYPPLGAPLMAGVAAASFAKNVYGICKDFKKQKARLAAQTNGKVALRFWDYAKDNKLRMFGAVLSASTVAVSGLGVAGVAVSAAVQSAKAKAGIGLAFVGAVNGARQARAAAIEYNKHLDPGQKPKNVTLAGLKAAAISALSFGAGYAGGHVGGNIAINAYNSISNPNVDVQTPIDTQTPTVENTTPAVENTTLNDVSNQTDFGLGDWRGQEPQPYQPSPELPEGMAYDENGQLVDVSDATLSDVNNQTDFGLGDWRGQEPQPYQPSPELPEGMTYDENGQLVDIPEGMTLDEQGNIVPEVTAQSEVSPQDIEFWDKRVEQFIGKETAEILYSRIDSGEIKLPEGIECKEEFAYKLVMAMEQSPEYVAKELGIEMPATDGTDFFESKIPEMTAEQFSKLSGLMNDYSDRGVYIGDNPFETTPTNAPVNEEISDTSNTPPNREQMSDSLPQGPLDEAIQKAQAQILRANDPIDAPVIDSHPVRNDGFSVVVREEGGFKFYGATPETFEDAAKNLVGRDTSAVHDVSHLLHQNAILQDIDQQIADGARFSDAEMAQIDALRNEYADNLAQVSEKYNLPQNTDLDTIATQVIADNYAEQLRIPDIEIDKVVYNDDGTAEVKAEIDGKNMKFNIESTNDDHISKIVYKDNGTIKIEYESGTNVTLDKHNNIHLESGTVSHTEINGEIARTGQELGEAYRQDLSQIREQIEQAVLQEVKPGEEIKVARVVDVAKDQETILTPKPATVIQAEPNIVEPLVTGIDIVQPSVDDQWLPGDSMNGFVEKLHNLSSEIRENNAMIDTSNLADNPKIQYEVYETDVLGKNLDPQIQQDLIDTATTYGRRLDAMVEHGYGTHEHFEHQGWSTDRYIIGGETFEISRDTGADADGRINITHIDANGVETLNRLEADGTSMTQINKPNQDSIVIHRDASGNIIDDNPANLGHEQSVVSPMEEISSEYLKDVKDLGLENPRHLSLYASEYATDINGDAKGYAYYSRFDVCDNGYAATNSDGALGLVFDEQGHGTFKISENDSVRTMDFKEAQSFAKAIMDTDKNVTYSKLAAALYDNNPKEYALHEANLNGLTENVTTLEVGDSIVAFSDKGVSLTFSGRSYHAVLDESGNITETSSMLGTKIDGISNESMKDALQIVLKQIPETSIAQAYAALEGNQAGETLEQPAQPVVETPTIDNPNPVYQAPTYTPEELNALVPAAEKNSDGTLNMGPFKNVEQTAYNGTIMMMQNDIFQLAQNDAKYMEMIASGKDVSEFTPQEQEFFLDHKEKLDLYNLTHGQDGKLVTIDASQLDISINAHSNNGITTHEINITDNNGNNIYNLHVPERHFSTEYVDNLLPSEEMGSNLARGQLSNLLSRNAVYEEILAKDNPSLGEKVFMQSHEQLLERHGITRADDGTLVRTDTLDHNHKAGDGVSYECTKAGIEISHKGSLTEIQAHDKVYQDLLERQSDGRINALEQKFIREHEASLQEQHMYHDPKGNLVKLPDEVSVTKDGAAYRIQANIVAEPSAYGMSQQDYLADAKELLSGNKSATVSDRMAVKNFLMNDDIYNDLKARIDSGETFATSETAAINKFMASHESTQETIMQKYGLARGNDGEIYKDPQQAHTSQTSIMMNNARNGR